MPDSMTQSPPARSPPPKAVSATSGRTRKGQHQHQADRLAGVKKNMDNQLARVDGSSSVTATMVPKGSPRTEKRKKQRRRAALRKTQLAAPPAASPGHAAFVARLWYASLVSDADAATATSSNTFYAVLEGNEKWLPLLNIPTRKEPKKELERPLINRVRLNDSDYASIAQRVDAFLPPAEDPPAEPTSAGRSGRRRGADKWAFETNSLRRSTWTSEQRIAIERRMTRAYTTTGTHCAAIFEPLSRNPTWYSTAGKPQEFFRAKAAHLKAQQLARNMTLEVDTDVAFSRFNGLSSKCQTREFDRLSAALAPFVADEGLLRRARQTFDVSLASTAAGAREPSKHPLAPILVRALEEYTSGYVEPAKVVVDPTAAPVPMNVDTTSAAAVEVAAATPTVTTTAAAAATAMEVTPEARD